MQQGTIVKVAGPLIVAEGMKDATMYDVVRVSDMHLVGEIIELRGDRASIQVYEETTGLGPGEPVYSTGSPLSVELGPGLIESIFDGIQRPLTSILQVAGDRISRGVEVTSLNREKKWVFNPQAKVGDRLNPGDVLGTVQETAVVLHKIMVPPGVEGTLEWIRGGGHAGMDRQGRTHHCRAHRQAENPVGRDQRADHDAEMAGSPGPSLPGENCAQRAHGYGSAGN